MLPPFGHVVWSAICGGALWRVRGADDWQWKNLFHLRLLLFLFAASALHGLWDVKCADPNWWLWLLAIGVVSWAVVLFQARSGIEQVRECQASNSPRR